MALNSNFRTLTADNIEGVSADRNYLKSSFENGQLTGWTEVSVALTSGLPTGTPTISSTAASSLALSATSVTPLSGSRSLLVDVPSALTAGHGFISDEFTLDRMDLGKVLTVSFDYERVTGTYNFSGTLGSQTWMVYVYDATAGGANWIQPAGFLGMNQSSGPGRVACTFQSSVTAGQKYRIAVIASQAAAGASSIEFDNFTCSRQTAPIGPVVTDWRSYDGSFYEGTTNNRNSEMSLRKTFWRRVGDYLEVEFSAQRNGSASIGGSTAFYLTLPPGLVIDQTNMTDSNNGIFFNSNSTTFQGTFQAGAFIGSSQSAWFISQVGAVQHVYNNTNFPPNLFFGGQIRFKIQGWSSNVQLSNDTDTRVVAAAGNFASTSIPTQASEGSETRIEFFSKFIDTHDTTTITSLSKYTAPVSGIYKISAILTDISAAGAFAVILKLFKNGAVAANRFSRSDGNASQNGISGSFMAYLNAGDFVDFRIFQNSGSAKSFGPSSTWSIERLSGPSVIAASETVAYRGNRTAGNYATNNSSAVIAFNSTSVDTHNAMNTSTGTYTVPVSGIYEVIAKATISALTLSLHTFDLFMAGEQTQCFMFQDSTNNNYRTGIVSNIRRMNAGDQISFSVYSSLASTVICNTALTNSLQIKRIGN